ncbi:hypothetical protein INR49_004267, partial [Caranx melampygus]
MVHSTTVPLPEARDTDASLCRLFTGLLNLSKSPAMENISMANISLGSRSPSEPVTPTGEAPESLQGVSVPLQVFFCFVMVAILLVALLGNVVVCLMVYQRSAMRSAINILLASLAFADMMLAILNMPFALVTVVTTNWIFGDLFCRVSAMLFWAPQCVFGYSIEPGYHAYVLILMLVFFFMPFMVMLYTFMGILNTIRHNAIRIHSHPDSICLSQASKLGLLSLQRPFQMNIDMSFKTRAFTTILILFSVFTVCWAPFTAYSLVTTFSDGFYHKDSFFQISTWVLWLCYLKSALNPLIYYWRIKKFRDACLDLMPKYFKFLPQLPETRRGAFSRAR